MQRFLPSSFLGSDPRPPTSPSVVFDIVGLRSIDSTLLARAAGCHNSQRQIQLDGERLLALLSIAARRPISSDILSHITSAARFWEHGDTALANFRLNFAGLPQSDDPTDAARVALAAHCLDQGMAPRTLMKELGLDTSAFDLIKYDPNQPRVPAGSGAESGRWTSGSTDQSFVATLPSLLTETTPHIVAAFAEFASRFSVPTAVLGALIIPTPNDGGVSTGILPDAPDIHFRKDDPAGTLTLAAKAADGSDVTIVARNERGRYVDIASDNPLGRNLGGQLYLDFDAVQDAIQDVSPLGEPDERSKASKDEPKLCPAPTPDTPHWASDRAIAFEEDVHARVNPLAPIPRGFGVKVVDPLTGGNVFFDDCFRYAGDLVDGNMKAGDLVEVKGERIGYLYSQTWMPAMDKDIEQANKELRAADARGVGLKWYYAEHSAADAARKEFDANGLKRIVIGVMPPRRRR